MDTESKDKMNEQIQEGCLWVRRGCLFIFFLQSAILLNLVSSVIVFLPTAISFLIIPFILYCITGSKPRLGRTWDDTVCLLTSLYIYFLCYAVFWVYFYMIPVEALGTAFLLLVSPWVVNGAVLGIYVVFYIIRRILKKRRKGKI